MLLAAIAAHPACPEPLLVDLITHPDGPRWTRPLAVHTAATTNPALSAAAVRELLDIDADSMWHPLMRRPTTTPQRALDLIGASVHPRPWTAALSCVHDPGDVLVHRALEITDHHEITAFALRAATTAGGRLAAASALARRGVRQDSHRAQLRSFLLDYPEHREHLLAVADPTALDALTADEDAEPGSAQWCATVGREEVLRYARAGEYDAWTQVVWNAPDPDGSLAATALRECAAPVVAAAVLRRDNRPCDVHADAAVLVLTSTGALGGLPNACRTRIRALTATGPVRVALAALTRDGLTSRNLTSITSRTDLTEADLDQVVAAVGFPTPRRESTDTLWLTLSAWLVSHPQATAAHRDLARAWLALLTRDALLAGDRARLGTAYGPDRGHVEDIHEVLGSVESAGRGGQLPVAVVEHPTFGALPGVRAAVDAYLAAVLPRLGAGAGPLMRTLLPGFDGTVADLLDTTATVTAAA